MSDDAAYPEVQEWSKNLTDQDGSSDKDDDPPYVTFQKVTLKCCKGSFGCSIQHLLLFFLPDTPEEAKVLSAFENVLHHFIKPETISKVDVLDCEDDADLSRHISNIIQADRIIFIGSKKFERTWNERVSMEGGLPSSKDPILDIVIQRLEENRVPGHDRMYAAFFEWGIKNILPEYILKKQVKHYELSCGKPASLENICRRLCHKKGQVKLPNAWDISGSPERKKFCKHLQYVKVLREQIQHGEQIGFSPTDFEGKLLDLFLQHRILTREEAQTVKLQHGLVTDRLEELFHMITNKCGPESHYTQLVHLWLTSINANEFQRIVKNRVKFIGELRFLEPYVLNSLQEQNVISSYVAETIRTLPNTYDKARRLLDELPKSMVAVVAFREVLQRDHKHLAELLDEEESDESDSDSSRQSSTDMEEQQVTNIGFLSATSTSIKIQWSRDQQHSDRSRKDSCIGYVLYYAPHTGESSYSYKQIRLDDKSLDSYDVTGLQPGTTYVFKIAVLTMDRECETTGLMYMNTEKAKGLLGKLKTHLPGK
ncbi:uncharacterized protein LOC144360022 [Saccoglossus kowalevskii]